MFNVIATDDFSFRGQFGVIDSGSKLEFPSSSPYTKTGGTRILDWATLTRTQQIVGLIAFIPLAGCQLSLLLLS